MKTSKQLVQDKFCRAQSEQRMRHLWYIGHESEIFGVGGSEAEAWDNAADYLGLFDEVSHQ